MPVSVAVLCPWSKELLEIISLPFCMFTFGVWYTFLSRETYISVACSPVETYTHVRYTRSFMAIMSLESIQQRTEKYNGLYHLRFVHFEHTALKMYLHMRNVVTVAVSNCIVGGLMRWHLGITAFV